MTVLPATVPVMSTVSGVVRLLAWLLTEQVAAEAEVRCPEIVPPRVRFWVTGPGVGAAVGVPPAHAARLSTANADAVRIEARRVISLAAIMAVDHSATASGGIVRPMSRPAAYRGRVGRSFSQRYEVLTLNATRLFTRVIDEQRTALADHLRHVASGKTVAELQARAAARPDAIRRENIIREDPVSDVFERTLREIAADAAGVCAYTQRALDDVAAAVEHGEDRQVATVRAYVENTLAMGEPGVWTGSLTPVALRWDREVG